MERLLHRGHINGQSTIITMIGPIQKVIPSSAVQGDPTVRSGSATAEGKSPTPSPQPELLEESLPGPSSQRPVRPLPPRMSAQCASEDQNGKR
jgi:hypothetical protein